MRLLATDFTVRGRGEFPWDMLRSDEAFPVTYEDGWRMAHCRENHREVSLRTHRRGGPTEARWASFGWTVIRTSGVA